MSTGGVVDLSGLSSFWQQMEDWSERNDLPPFLAKLAEFCKLLWFENRTDRTPLVLCAPIVDNGTVYFVVKSSFTEGGDAGFTIESLYCTDRRKGRAERALGEVCRSADDAGAMLFADALPESDQPMTFAEIRKWIERHGFVYYGYEPGGETLRAVRAPAIRKGSALDIAACSRRALHGVAGNSDWQRRHLFYRSDNIARLGGDITIEFNRARHTAIRPAYEGVFPTRWCFQNVQRQVRECGGEVVLGWQVCRHAIWGGGTELEAHAIWRRPDGLLVEVTRGDPDWLFAPSNGVQLNERSHILAVSESFIRESGQRPFLTQPHTLTIPNALYDPAGEPPSIDWRGDIRGILHAWPEMLDFSSSPAVLRALPPFMAAVATFCRTLPPSDGKDGHPLVWCAPMRDEGAVYFTLSKATLNGMPGFVLDNLLSSKRREGRVSRCVAELCKLADEANVPLAVLLEPKADKPMSTDELGRWLDRFGFRADDHGRAIRFPAQIRTATRTSDPPRKFKKRR